MVTPARVKPRSRFVSRRIPWLVLAPLAVAFSAAILVLVAGRATMSRATDRTLGEHTATLVAACEELGRDRASLRALLDRVHASDASIAIRVFDEEGRLIDGVGDLQESNIARALEGVRSGARSVSVTPDGERPLLVHLERVDFAVGERRARVVVVAHDRTTENKEWTLTMALVGGLAALVTLVAALSSLRLSRRVGARLDELVRASDAVAAGALDAHVDESPLMELENVARAFNGMASALESARRELDAELHAKAQLEQRFRHAEALAIVGQVASSFAHEVGSPLNTILGWARLAEGDDVTLAEAKESCRTIVTQCERIQRIVERMLSVARPGADVRAEIDLASVADEVLAFLRAEARSQHVELKVTHRGRALTNATHDEVQQIVLNLVANALQEQPHGGLVHVLTSASADAVTLEVRDAGPGVPDEIAARIFEPFFTTKSDPSQRGTGLGLAVVDALSRELGGRVAVSRAEEGGAAFVVTLPRAGKLEASVKP
ncbi:MAG: HAMP domain-containing sensor histidine kinase [Polyangiaceae bacterium]